MNRRTLALLLAIALAAVLAGCAASEPDVSTPEQPVDQPGDAAGIRLAPGLYDQEDGTVLATGVLEYRDLEGGFWAIIDTTDAAGPDGKVVAVIANGADFAEELESLKGKGVDVMGKRAEGASVRMAGPEIEMTSIEAIDETPGIAE